MFGQFFHVVKSEKCLTEVKLKHKIKLQLSDIQYPKRGSVKQNLECRMV